MASKDKSKASFFGVPLFVAIAVAVIGGLVYGYMQLTNPSARKLLELTPEAKAYVTNLKLAGVDMKAHESYLGQKVIELTGTITNAGSRGIVSVSVICVFHDATGMVVLRERSIIVGAKASGLRPREAKPFRMPFDGVPDTWNQEMPSLVIASIQFS